MSPSRQIKRLRDFLKNRTNLYDEIFKQIAQTKFKEVGSHIGKQISLDDFILMHHKDIIKETDLAIENTCKQIISESKFSYLFKQIGLFSLFLVPPLYPLVRYAITLWPEIFLNKNDIVRINLPTLGEFSFCIVAILLLGALISAAAISVFKAALFPKTDTEN